jgi:hypothetical protein
MSKPSNETRAAAREILAAISHGTSVMKAPAFFRGLHQRLAAYTPARYAALTKWLHRAGIEHVPSKEQCAAAAKVAKRKHGPLVAPHPVHAEY